jgi:hypothetical protein
LKLNRQVVFLLVGVLWLLGMVSAFGAFFLEVVGSEIANYGRLVTEQDPVLIRRAHNVWYGVTALIGAAMVFTGLAYLLYVRWLQPIGQQERVIMGLKGRE